MFQLRDASLWDASRAAAVSAPVAVTPRPVMGLSWSPRHAGALGRRVVGFWCFVLWVVVYDAPLKSPRKPVSS